MFGEVTLKIYLKDGSDLLDCLRHIDLLELFKLNLKTHLFKAAFINYL